MLTRNGLWQLGGSSWLLVLAAVACVFVGGCQSGTRSATKVDSSQPQKNQSAVAGQPAKPARTVIDTKSRPVMSVSAAMKGKILNATASLVTGEGLQSDFESEQAKILEKARQNPGAKLLLVQFDVTEEAIEAAHAQYFGPSLFQAKWGNKVQDPDGATATTRIENNSIAYPSTVTVLYVVPAEVQQLDIIYVKAIIGTVNFH